ncbi:hypothetical protein [Candidatus Vallotia cooleyia]|uniref:hypothetical protein n=1 Tax=Candidatus Vallotiella adelgis TaxID=1177211 RepID=UPI001D02A6A2|nr:hypothetical protein [Candidatus Vallotia cooleyia]
MDEEASDIGVGGLLAAPRLAFASANAVKLRLFLSRFMSCFHSRGSSADFRQCSLLIEGCIVSELTSMRPIITHKGSIYTASACTGTQLIHRLPPKRLNAIEYAAWLIEYIQNVAQCHSSPRVVGHTV